MITLLLLHPALAAAPSSGPDPVLDAMVDELDRVEDLSLEGAPRAYFASYRVFDGDCVHLTASLGGLVRDDSGPSRQGTVSVRVGSADQDNGNFQSMFNSTRGFGALELVLAPDTLALRHDLWLQTDRAYKGAVENLARKLASERGETGVDPTPSFVLTPPIVAAFPAGAAPDHDALAALARAVSARFLTHPEVEASRVYIAAGGGRDLLVDTTGTRLVRPSEELDLRIVATARAADGHTISDHQTFIVRNATALPSQSRLEAAADDLAARLEHWRVAVTPEAPYVGPVIFEGDAAVDLFRRMLVPALSGTPPMERAHGGMGSDDESPTALSLKRRVLPPGFSVVDDPTAEPALPSSYVYDDEGVAAQRTPLVTDGIVRGLLASRIPSHDAPASNGHGRDVSREEVRAMPSFLQVAVERALSANRLYALALQTAKDYDLDHILVVRRLADPSLEQGSSRSFFLSMMGGSPAAELPDPVEVVERYADGHEVAVRGLQWNGVDRRILRDILAAGASTRATFLQPGGGMSFGDRATAGLPVTIEAPSVLVSEVELDPDTGAVPTVPKLPSPLLGG